MIHWSYRFLNAIAAKETGTSRGLFLVEPS